MSGLLALLDDVAAIAKVAAASIDDIGTAAAQAGAKAAGVVIDDAAVTPRYVTGFQADRELPIIWRIALGSLRNKLVFLLPVALTLESLAPQAITPLLMIGGAYLCFEGAEKVVHRFAPHADATVAQDFADTDPARLEQAKIAGAIKTDFVLSAEIMTIALAAIPDGALWFQAATLALVGVMITAGVYGAVALIVKADDLGLVMARRGRLALTRGLGRGLVRGMPPFMALLSTVGTLAMLWVGGSILLHGAEVLGWPAPAHLIHEWAVAVGAAVAGAAGAVQWLVTAALDGVFGLALGLVLVPVTTRVIVPLWAALRGAAAEAAGMTRWPDLAVLVGRILIAALFLGGALQKSLGPQMVEGLLAAHGWPQWLVWPALAFNLVAGLALVAGVGVRPVALALAGYCAVTSLFHFIPADPWQMSIFVKNWAIAGGCLVLAAHGAGRFAWRPES